MNKNWKIAGAAAVILAIIVLLFVRREYERSALEREGMKTFADTEGTLIFKYHPEWVVSAAEMGNMHFGSSWSHKAKGLGVSIVTVSAPMIYTSGTNLIEASFDIGRSADEEGVAKCTVPGDDEGRSGSASISGYPFTKFTSSDAGAGNFYETVSYRGIVDGDCYAVEYALHSMNIDNYPPDQVKEFDRGLLERELEDMVQSLKFL